MKKLTQTHLDNCWQTCVAMLLGVPAEVLPDQHQITGRDQYLHTLRVYLEKHHNLLYVEVGPEKLSEIKAQASCFHLLIGECARSSPENDHAWHAVVGRGGELYWDVSESRAGLTKVERYGLLVPFAAAPDAWRAEWQRRKSTGDVEMLCQCSSCRGRS